MRHLAALLIGLGLLGTPLCRDGAAAAQRTAQSSMIFVHHSIGRNFLHPSTGAMRDSLAAWNARKGTAAALWDHDYGEGHPVWGLSDPLGVNLGYAYGDEFNNTIQVAGYRALFTTANASLDSLMLNHDLIAFKCGYESGWLWLTTDEQLAAARTDYLAMRDFFDQHLEKQFVVVTQPPIHRNAPYLDERADRARQLSVFLGSDEFLAGHPNVHCFDLFDHLATPDDPTDPYRNTLRYEYEINHDNSDPHPNGLAGEVIGPYFARFLYNVSTTGHPTPVAPVPLSPAAPQLAVWPNPCNPRAMVHYELAQPAHVRLSVYDLAGRLVAYLVDEARAAGAYATPWDGRDARGRVVGSGVYLVCLFAGGEFDTHRVTVVR